MRLRDVVEHPGGRLPVLVGREELDRPLQAAFTTDLLDPARYLSGGELVLTGLMWRRCPDDSRTFVEHLAKAGVAALGAGEGLLGGVPDDVVAACERYEVPLFAVPADTSFREITDRITSVLWTEREADSLAARSRRRGMGAALTAGMTCALFGRYDAVALGVYPDNVGAIRLYRRLGFTAAERRTSVELA